MAKPKPTCRPFAKVTEETSLPLHERHEIQKKERQQREQYKTTTKEDTSKTKANAPTQTTKSAKELARSKKPTSAPKPMAKHEGLRGVEYTYKDDAPLKKVVRCTCDDDNEVTQSGTKRKLPHVPLLPGQESYVPLSESENDSIQEFSDEEEPNKNEEYADESGIEELDVQATDKDGEGSDVATVLEEASDIEDFAVEYGEPSDLGLLALDRENVAVANRQVSTAQPARNAGVLVHSNIPLQPIVDNVPTLTSASNLPVPSGMGLDAPVFITQGHGIGVFEPVEPEHLFGPPQNVPPTLSIKHFPPEELTLFDLPPESLASASNPYHNASNAITFNFNFLSSNNVLDIAGIPWSSVGAPALNTDQTAYSVFQGFTDVTLGTQGSQPNSQSFIDQMQDGSVPGLVAKPCVTAANSPSLAPHSSHASIAHPEMSHSVFAVRISAGLHAVTPVRSQMPMLTPSRPFSRSVSTPLPAPLHRPSGQPGTPLQSNTCPSTPVELPNHFLTATGLLALPPPNSALPTPVPSTPVRPTLHDPMQLQVATGNMETPMGQGGSISDFLLPFGTDNSGIDKELNFETRQSLNPDVHTSERTLVKESVALPSAKRCWLLSLEDILPTDREIDNNIRLEWKSIKSKRKANPPKPGGARPRKGTNKGVFSCEQQEFMTVGQAHISWEQISQTPWMDTPEEMQNRAVDVAKEVMGMRTDFVNKEFKDTMMHSDSQDRARCSTVALKFAGEIIQGSHQSIDDHIVEDLFLYNGDPSNPANFFKTAQAISMTVELLFNSGMNLGGIHI